ncbi:LysR family transcriptional regulator [Thalassotalea sp. LPB0316]|uniref:LysR family transcriptional regulator n=1 Tax=Thalassotalea sp. LPB0316 TaxID=2769490 RepID=UPI001868A513|nr:LysR family transcriptional regulator [Thalassotalea sp. LPB0316]QOL25919.1 LysR family transcriptional regulator [Thalassotalea sp. LPB0316]
MDLKALQYFIAVYEQKSLTKAAKICFVAQPSISSAIMQLEQSLNTELFSRHPRGVVPLVSANQLYPLAKQLLGQADAVKNLFSQAKQHIEFKLGVTRGLGVQRMSALLKDFTAISDNIALSLVAPEQSCNARIITTDELSPHEQSVNLWQESYLLALPYNHVLALQPSLQLRDLDQLTFIARSPCNAGDALAKLCHEKQISLDVRAKIRTIDYALGLVSAGLGAALVPAYPEVLEKTDIVFKTIEEFNFKRQVVFAYDKLSPTLKPFIEVVKRHR